MDGFGGYFFAIERRANKNAVQWIITEKLADSSYQPMIKNPSVQAVTNQLLNVPSIPQYVPQQPQQAPATRYYRESLFLKEVALKRENN